MAECKKCGELIHPDELQKVAENRARLGMLISEAKVCLSCVIETIMSWTDGGDDPPSPPRRAAG